MKLKVVLAGDSGVGKTSIYNRLTDSTYNPHGGTTIGASVRQFNRRALNGTVYNLSLWDTAGQERYKSIMPLYLEHVDFLLVVCSIIDRTSFCKIPEWIEMTRQKSESARVIMIANKCDLREDIAVTTDELDELAASLGAIAMIETSAKTATGFEALMDTILLAAGSIDPSIMASGLVELGADEKVRGKSGCC